MILILPSQALVLNAYAVLIGSTPGSTAFSAHQAYIAGSTTASGLTGAAGAAAGAAAYKSALNELFASQTTAALATTMLANLGLSTAFTQAQAEAFLTANASNRVGAMMDLASQLYIYSGTDAGLSAAKAAYVAKVDGSYAYSAVAGNTATQVLAGTGPAQTFTLTTGVDSVMGTAFADIFLARTQNGANTFNDADTIDGGAGADTVYLDFVSVGNAITPALKNVETVVVRAQSAGTDANGTGATDGNNQLNSQTVQIDAQRSLEVNSANKVMADVGVTNWESSNSRSDVIIEDVRIGNTQKTKDVTITFRESDPGNVDFGVYFDQHSLRNSGSGSSSLTIQIMDTGAAASADVAISAKPLLNNPYDTFKIGINGVLQSINLNTTAAPTTAASADTYAQLLTAFQAALLAGGSGATAALGSNFTVIDPLSGKSVTGTSIVITGGAGITFSDTVAGAGWVNTTGAAVPNSSNIYTTFNTGSTSVTELVTSKVVLDDVGRGSTGGDLVIGGMSVGDTSLSRGVERFEITVEDSSKLQTINGTNNALREVTIVNGTTSNATSAYNTVVTNAGSLTVNGRVSADLAMGGDTPLVGVNNGRYSDHDVTGFTDVRLIDGSAMTGSLAFTAGITSDSIRKYITQVDTAANPFSDVAGTGNVNFNVPGANFVYTGGANNDTMTVTIDTAAVSSRSTVVSGLSDFTFNLDGGAGNDAITLTIEGAGLAGGAQAWYNNQKLNANITIKGGAGNDTVRIPGAGDVIIDLGDGNDTVYTDNTGSLGATATAGGRATAAAIAYSNAQAAELARAIGVKATADGSNATITTDIVARLETLANGITGLAAIPPAAITIVATDNALETLTTAAANIDLAGASLGYRAITAAQKTQLDAVIDAAAAAGTAATAAHVTSLMAIVQPILDAARVADAAAKAADTAAGATAYLTATATAVVNATAAVNAANLVVTDLAAIKAASTVAATDASITAALETAVLNASITGTAGTATSAVEAQLTTAIIAGGANTVIQAEVDALVAILTPLQNTAAATAATAAATLAAAIATDNAARDTIIGTAGFLTTGNAASLLSKATADVNTAALNTANTAVTTATTKVSDLTALKAALVANMSDADYLVVLANAVTKGTITAGEQTNILAASAATVNVVGTAMTAAEDTRIDQYIDTLLVPANKAVTEATNVAAYWAAQVALDNTAVTVATAAELSGANDLTIAANKAVYVFNTADQTATYKSAVQDERHLADIKSDASNTYNFFNSTVKVTYKGIDASVVVAGTNFVTTDLEINQAIKNAINTDAVLSKLLLATDGPANSLVVTSLIDGAHATTNLAVSVTVPTTAGASVAAAATAYGLAAGATDAQVIAVMTAARTAFNTKGDYTTQFAESGAAGGNTTLVGANSTSSSDNTVTPGTGNDVIVLGTTVRTDIMTSSNEQVIYSGTFGADTIVNFAAAGLGADALNFAALNGRGSAFGSLSADKSIVVGAATATPLTAAQIAALFTDSATAINHVYVAVDSTNIGSIWTVADAAGTAAGNVTATLVGSIDLADTAWSTLTAGNFV